MTNDSNASLIVKWLFETSAVRVADPEQPFWYTSGTLGPYYINTHFLYGSQKAAEELLEKIEQGVKTAESLPEKLAQETIAQYNNNEIYRGLIDLMIARLNEEDFDLISGGERRDFFFSIPIAILMNKPHLTILKDGRSLYSNQGLTLTNWTEAKQLEGCQVMHIADLVTEASSYIRAWLPSVKYVAGKMAKTMAVVDRCQGGAEILKQAGTELISMTSIDESLFNLAVQAGLMTAEQKTMIDAFTADPHSYMKDFLRSHPDFLDQQLSMGGKNAERARLCLEKGYGK
ncbi:MAG: orotate phosphoribosyltransferase [Clostridiaceae bacterium]|nr:orotate phosphoribosyltransferase [Clostridiaceae bacterium]